MNVASLFEKCAARFGAALALHDLQTGEKLDFRALHQTLGDIAAGLDGLKVAVGERVALLGNAELAYLLCDYGVMSAGRVRVPLDPALSVAEQAAQIVDAGAVLLVHAPALAARAAELVAQVPGLRVVEAGQLRNAASEAAPVRELPVAGALASLSYTGGTTGGPKAVMVTHGSLTAAVQNIVAARGMGLGDVMLNVRPAWPIAAVILLAHLAAGGTVLMGGKFEPAGFLDLLQAHRVAATSLVPTHLARLMGETDPRQFDLSALRAIDIGAAAVPPELFARVLDAFGARIGILYGLTEAPWSCYQPPSAFITDAQTQARRMRSVGHALFSAEVVIRSLDGVPLAPGEEGEVTIRGPHVTPGYWQRPEADENAFRDGWFRTGDLGVIDGDGVLSITGRIKELIRSGGKSIVPAEVESVLRAHPAVADTSVFGLPDQEWGEIVAAAVVLRAGQAQDDALPPDEAALIEWCRERLSGFKKPRRIFFLTDIPRSHYGKVQRKPLLELIAPFL